MCDCDALERKEKQLSAVLPQRRLLITIDGPAGSGKTTVSKSLADRLGYRYIDTGALYRGIAYAVHRAGLTSPDDDPAIASLCRQVQLSFELREQGLRLMLGDEDITDRIRSPEISMLASTLSAKKIVRQALLQTQRELAKSKKAVFEGRDMGTVVFPNADLKFFLDADHAVRARRRHLELAEKTQPSPSLEAVEKDMKRRDQNDSSRSISPLKPAEDAVRIDSTRLSVDQVVETMIGIIVERFGSSH